MDHHDTILLILMVNEELLINANSNDLFYKMYNFLNWTAI